MKTVMCVQNLCKLCCCGNTFNFFAVSVSQRLPDMYSLNLEISPGNTTTAIITFQKAVPWSTPASMPQMSAVCPRKTHKSCLGTTNDETAGYGGICLQCKVIMRRRNVWRLTLCKKRSGYICIDPRSFWIILMDLDGVSLMAQGTYVVVLWVLCLFFDMTRSCTVSYQTNTISTTMPATHGTTMHQLQSIWL